MLYLGLFWWYFSCLARASRIASESVPLTPTDNDEADSFRSNTPSSFSDGEDPGEESKDGPSSRTEQKPPSSLSAASDASEDEEDNGLDDSRDSENESQKQPATRETRGRPKVSVALLTEPLSIVNWADLCGSDGMPSLPCCVLCR